jgi:DNA-binding XRE family transcriptional regulator
LSPAPGAFISLSPDTKEDVMAQTVLLITDRPAFEATWSAACQDAGLSARPVAPDAAPAALTYGIGAVFDASSQGFDEDELLACVALSRALGALPAVALPSGETFAAIEDVLEELCGGLISRLDSDVARVTSGLSRRCDTERQMRFEYLSVSPRGGELIAVLGDGTTLLLARPLSAEDDGSEIQAIVLAANAGSATIELSAGKRALLSAAELATKGNGVEPLPASLGDVDGVRLGQRLRALRLAEGLTQAELARRTGIHRPNIARVEAGRHTPSLETLARLAAAIGVPIKRVLSD